MILEQLYLGCLAQASYVVADESSGVALVVDPRRDVGDYLDLAARHGLRIGHVALTHFHADFAAGHVELARRTGAEIHLGARARADFRFSPRTDGERIVLGPEVEVEVRETPGHTPESISLVVWTGGRPHAVLTGDTLFVGDVGRPDLAVAAGWSPEELAGLLWESIETRLLTLPDETIVYPGHGPGSLCGKNLGPETVSTIGQQRRSNPALLAGSRESFVASVTAEQPRSPAYFAWDAAWNRREPPPLAEALEGLHPLGLDEVLRLRNAGARILDVREPDAWAAGHLAGSLNVGLSGSFASWAGAVLDPEAAVVLVAEPGRETEAAVRLGRIGFDRVEGYLDGGPAAFGDQDELVARVDRIGPEQLAERLGSAEPPFLVDVRTRIEHDDRHIDGSHHIPLAELPERLAEIPRDREIAVHCRSGYRSSIAASLLEEAGFARIVDLAGGFLAWQSVGVGV